MAVRLGGLAAKSFRLGTGAAAVTPKRVMLGTGSSAVEIWTDVVPLAAMGMSKAGASQPVGNGVKLTGFVPRDGYPSTVIVDDCLVANGNGVRVVQFAVKVGANTGSRPISLMHNGVAVATVTVPLYSGGPFSGEAELTLAPGDRLWLEATGSGSTKSVIGDSSTFVSWE